MNQAIELISFINRKNEDSNSQNSSRRISGREEKDTLGEFMSAQMTFGPASPMSDDLKDAIRWTEEKRKEHGMN